MKRFSQILLLVCCFLAVKTAQAEHVITYEEQKVIEKTFNVDPSHQLKVSNRYGKVNLQNWDNNQIKVKITIRTEESSRQRAKDALESVEIKQSADAQMINFETVINKRSESWWNNITNVSNSSLSIDYEVYLPRYTGIIIKNSYGEVVVPDRDGRVDLNVSYGQLKAGRLNSASNLLKVAYSGVKVQSINEGSVDIKYGSLQLGAAKELNLDLSYCSGSSVGEVAESAIVNLRYSSNFEIGLGRNIQKGNIKASYSSLTVVPNKEAKFDVNVAVIYAKFKYPEGRTKVVEHDKKNHISKSYVAAWNGGGTATVYITSSYGNVSLR